MRFEPITFRFWVKYTNHLTGLAPKKTTTLLPIVIFYIPWFLFLAIFFNFKTKETIFTTTKCEQKVCKKIIDISISIDVETKERRSYRLSCRSISMQQGFPKVYVKFNYMANTMTIVDKKLSMNSFRLTSYWEPLYFIIGVVGNWSSRYRGSRGNSYGSLNAR